MEEEDADVIIDLDRFENLFFGARWRHVQIETKDYKSVTVWI